jgi:putative acyl-CoA dehydrogenase
MHYQLEQGTSCPLTMTFAGVPVLEGSNANGAFTEWIAKLTAPHYDARDVHISLKRSAMMGMSMTEKQGGSDVRSNTTTAEPVSLERAEEFGSPYKIVGHKWFTSAPMCDGFLTLAYTREGLTCFLIPRWLSPTERNTGLRFQRLKNKLGDRSNASSEVEYHGAVGYLVGKRGHGVRTIIEMVNLTRLDCLLGSGALMQAALFHAVSHTVHRKAFGSALADKPLMRNVLTDLAIEAEAATALGMRVAHSFDDPSLDPYRRLAVAIGKYFVCKRSPAFVYEALECMGGNGYVEDFPLSRYFRQSPLNAIWEGSGNVIVLDIFRALAKDPAGLQAIVSEIESTGHPILRSRVHELIDALRKANVEAEMQGRALAEGFARLLQASALYHSNRDVVYHEFVESRITAERPGTMFGTLRSDLVNPAIMDRHMPVMTAEGRDR